MSIWKYRFGKQWNNKRVRLAQLIELTPFTAPLNTHKFPHSCVKLTQGHILKTAEFLGTGSSPLLKKGRTT